MKKFNNEADLPANASYLGSDDCGPGSMSESMADGIDRYSEGKSLGFIVDKDGIRSFFAY